MEQLPTFSIDLIEELDRIYPEKAPDPKDTEREIWIKAGKRELVRNLVAMKEQAENQALDPNRL